MADGNNFRRITEHYNCGCHKTGLQELRSSFRKRRTDNGQPMTIAETKEEAVQEAVSPPVGFDET